MFNLNRKEQVALLTLSLSLLVGGTISYLDWKDPSYIEDFRVIPEAIQPTSDSLEVPPDEIDITININRANFEQLQRLPNIGPKLAERIIKFREQNGPFKSVEDLDKVEGIGSKTIEKLKELASIQ